MNEEATLKPTAEFFNMILYNSDPNSKVGVYCFNIFSLLI